MGIEMSSTYPRRRKPTLNIGHCGMISTSVQVHTTGISWEWPEWVLCEVRWGCLIKDVSWLVYIIFHRILSIIESIWVIKIGSTSGSEQHEVLLFGSI